MDVSVNVETCDLGFYFPLIRFLVSCSGFPLLPCCVFHESRLMLIIPELGWVGFTAGLERGDLKKGYGFGLSSIIPLLIRIDCCFVFMEILNISARSKS